MGDGWKKMEPQQDKYERGFLGNRQYMCVIDLEATCWEDPVLSVGPEGQTVIDRRNEIIEIGAVLLRMKDMVIVSEFDAFIKPKLEPILSDFCKKLTSIKQEDVDGALPFPAANDKAKAWLDVYGMDDVLFGSWGRYDWKQWRLDCELHGVPFPFTGGHYNIKQYVIEALVEANPMWNHKKRGMATVMNGLDIRFEGTAHRGIDDARMCAKVLQKVGYYEPKPKK